MHLAQQSERLSGLRVFFKCAECRKSYGVPIEWVIERVDRVVSRVQSTIAKTEQLLVRK